MESAIVYRGKETSTEKWFHDEVAPTLIAVNSIILLHWRDIDVKLFVMYWEAFVRHSHGFFGFCMHRNCITPVAMSMRLFFEYASDLNFLCLYPENIQILQDKAKQCQPKHILGKPEPMEMARESAEVRLYKYENGNKCKRYTGTEDRVKLAFIDGGEDLYDYLSCYSHVNYVGATWNSIHNLLEGDFWRKERINMIKLYPEALSVFIHSLGRLCSVKEIEEYDFSALEQKFKEIG